MSSYCEEKFSAPKPTPKEEFCSCSSLGTLVVMHALGFNPVHCIKCNLEVPPAILDIPNKTIDALASWNRLASALEALWLDSGEYESWAEENRTKISGQFNRLGMEATKLLSEHYPAVYWIQIPEPSEYPPKCPGCGNEMLERKPGKFVRFICDGCSLLTAPSEFKEAI